MGLPEITVIFKTKGLTAIKRSERGIVACVLKDDTEGGKELNVYESVLDVDYLDPPYFKAERYYEGFSPDDHIRLCQCLCNIKGHFMLSYNDHPDIRQFYKAFHIHSFARHNNLAAKKGAGAGTYSELIITNY